MEPQPEPQNPESAVVPTARPARKPRAVTARKPAKAKPAKVAKVAKVAKPAKVAKVAKVAKPVAEPIALAHPAAAKPRAGKYSFTLSDNDMVLLAALKQRSAGIGPVARKSDIVRAALHLLGDAGADVFSASLAALTPLERKK